MKETDIAGILTSTRTIALVGASDKPDRPSYRVMKYLLDQGYHVIPVSPRLPGKRYWDSKGMRRWRMCRRRWIWWMSSVIQKRHGVLRRRRLPSGQKTLWMQLGVINEPAAVLARDAGLAVVMDRCPAIGSRLGLAK